MRIWLSNLGVFFFLPLTLIWKKERRLCLEAEALLEA
jgi:hypothetical protein